MNNDVKMKYKKFSGHYFLIVLIIYIRINIFLKKYLPLVTNFKIYKSQLGYRARFKNIKDIFIKTKSSVEHKNLF